MLIEGSLLACGRVEVRASEVLAVHVRLAWDLHGLGEVAVRELAGGVRRLPERAEHVARASALAVAPAYVRALGIHAQHLHEALLVLLAVDSRARLPLALAVVALEGEVRGEADALHRAGPRSAVELAEGLAVGHEAARLDARLVCASSADMIVQTQGWLLQYFHGNQQDCSLR